MLGLETGISWGWSLTVVPGARIELATPAFSGRRSTNELPRQFGSFSILGALASGVNSGYANACDEMRQDANEQGNHAQEASPAAACHAERRLLKKGHR